MNRFKLGRVGKGVYVYRVVDRSFRPDLFLRFLDLVLRVCGVKDESTQR